MPRMLRISARAGALGHYSEAVMMVGAFARAFDVKGAEIEGPLAHLVADALRPTRDRLAADAPRGIPAARARPGTSVREAWIRDFVLVRHQPAHGKLHLRPSAWPLREQLLLGSLAFPLALKAVLSRPPFALYTLTDDDRTAVEIFEILASEDAFAHERQQDDGDPHNRRRPAWERLRMEYVDQQTLVRMKASAAAHGIRLGDEPHADAEEHSPPRGRQGEQVQSTSEATTSKQK